MTTHRLLLFSPLYLTHGNSGYEAEQPKEKTNSAPPKGITILVRGDDCREGCERHSLNEKDAYHRK